MTAGTPEREVDSRYARMLALPVTVPPPPPPPPPSAQGSGQYYPAAGHPYGYQQPTPTNGMAIAALVGALFISPLGIVLGHIALSQIKRTGEQGRGLAVAGTIIGYIGTAIWIFCIVWLIIIANAFTSALNDIDSDYDYYTTPSYTTPSYSTYTTTASPSYNSASTADVIDGASVGDCIQRTLGSSNGDGTSSVIVAAVSCSSSSATHRVVSRGTSTSSCAYDWVQTDNPVVVLCLSEL
jgi:hypothetical protein